VLGLVGPSCHRFVVVLVLSLISVGLVVMMFAAVAAVVMVGVGSPLV